MLNGLGIQGSRKNILNSFFLQFVAVLWTTKLRGRGLKAVVDFPLKNLLRLLLTGIFYFFTITLQRNYEVFKRLIWLIKAPERT